MGFMRNFRSIFIFALWVSFIANSPGANFVKDNIDSHLDLFASFDVTHHDNIDDEPHTHKHKHSEDGEEHDHGHDHLKLTQSELKSLSHYSIDLPIISTSEMRNSFFEKKLISSPHPMQIYRPPIFV